MCNQSSKKKKLFEKVLVADCVVVNAEFIFHLWINKLTKPDIACTCMCNFEKDKKKKFILNDRIKKM